MTLMESGIARVRQYLVDAAPGHDVAAKEKSHRGAHTLRKAALRSDAQLVLSGELHGGRLDALLSRFLGVSHARADL